jgi:hypothetical protein
MSAALRAVEAAILEGEQTDPVGAIVIGVTGVLLFAITMIRRWRKRRSDDDPPLHSFLDIAP